MASRSANSWSISATVSFDWCISSLTHRPSGPPCITSTQGRRAAAPRLVRALTESPLASDVALPRPLTPIRHPFATLVKRRVKEQRKVTEAGDVGPGRSARRLWRCGATSNQGPRCPRARSARSRDAVVTVGAAVTGPMPLFVARNRGWDQGPLRGGRRRERVGGEVVMAFIDRADAGRRLAARLQHLRGDQVVVLGLPRGGVPVAYEVARALDAPLDVIVVRKLGVPFQPELAMGAIGEEGVRIINEEVVSIAGISASQLDEVEARERTELEVRVRRFRGGRPPIGLEGRIVVVVDDGIATGSTARAACQVARARGAARVVLAVPVAPPDWRGRLGKFADELVCLHTPDPFYAVGQFYDNFTQTSDEEVVACLERAARPVPRGATTSATGNDPPSRDEEVEVRAGPVQLGGHLTLAEDAIGVVVFAHGSGSGRHSPRNRYVATVLNEEGLATL